MTIDLTKEEWEFLERMVKRAVVFAEMKDPHFQSIADTDYEKATKLLDKFVRGRQ